LRLAFLEQFLLKKIHTSAVFTNLIPVVRFAVNPFVDGVVSVFENVNISKMDLDLAGVVTDVSPNILFLPVNFTVLLKPVLGIIIVLDSSHFEFTNNVTVVDIPMTEHLGERFVNATVVTNSVCVNVLLDKRNLAVFNGAFNVEVADIIAASASNGIDGEYYLQGIGYREQELQVSKTTRFASEEATGVAWASYAGGTHIFIKGVGFVKENPEGHSLKFVSHEFGETIFAPPMT